MNLKHPYRLVNYATWPRRGHFEVFGQGEYPYIGITTTVDVTALMAGCRERDVRFFNAFLYTVTRALNSVENFRLRVFEDRIVLCDQIDPTFNVFDQQTDLFYFAYAEFSRDFMAFNAEVERAKEAAIANRSLASNWLDVVYISCLPWFGYSDIIQPMGLTANDTIPRIIWGKYETRESGATTVPFSIAGHHGLFDGVHISRLLEAMTALLARPEFLTDGG
ncbi:MAG: hypothetical protein LIP77_01980 [Planctomycetes bacterium]|nr:hypothetical protein [Planctomycetota bacterium]